MKNKLLIVFAFVVMGCGDGVKENEFNPILTGGDIENILDKSSSIDWDELTIALSVANM